MQRFIRVSLSWHCSSAFLRNWGASNFSIRKRNCSDAKILTAGDDKHRLDRCMSFTSLYLCRRYHNASSWIKHCHSQRLILQESLLGDYEKKLKEVTSWLSQHEQQVDDACSHPVPIEPSALLVGLVRSCVWMTCSKFSLLLSTSC